MAGRKPKPLQLHLIDGTKSHVKEQGIEFTPLDELPAPPDYLGPEGVKMWNEFGRELQASGVLQVLDVYALAQLCSLWERFVHDVRNGNERRASDETALRFLFSEFGATPAARRKVGPGNANKNRHNPFDKFKQPA